MHHGLHEKQLSNIFRWLLDAEGTHKLGSQFVHIFIDELNLCLGDRPPLPKEDYLVRQEVNTSADPQTWDIADLVLESASSVVVIENYVTSDGHGHSFNGYQNYAVRDGRRGEVVLLCRDVDHSMQTLGWEAAPVLTYGRLVQRLHEALSDEKKYQRAHPEPFAFIDQLHRKFVTGRNPMEERDVLSFLVAMCDSGEARRYQEQRPAAAAEQFASDLAVQARERFGESREVLQRLKGRLKSFADGPLRQQLDTTLGEGIVRSVSARYAGIYQWTINFDVDDPGPEFGESRLQIKFGPSAWFANERDAAWKVKPVVRGPVLGARRRHRDPQRLEPLLPVGEVQQPLEVRAEGLATLGGVLLQPVPRGHRDLDGGRCHTVSIPMISLIERSRVRCSDAAWTGTAPAGPASTSPTEGVVTLCCQGGTRSPQQHAVTTGGAGVSVSPGTGQPPGRVERVPHTVVG